jgi:hypothetical protein
VQRCKTPLRHRIGMATSRAPQRSLAHKPLDDFGCLGMIVEAPTSPTGRPTLPSDNFAGLMKWLEANKGRTDLASAGLGAASHLRGLLRHSPIKIDMQTVPRNGAAPAMTDLLGGQARPVRHGQRRRGEGGQAPRVAGAGRGQPTSGGSGLKGFDASVWHGLYPPEGTPQGGDRADRRGAEAAARQCRIRHAPQARGGARRGDRHRRARAPRRTPEVRRARDPPVAADHQGRRAVRAPSALARRGRPPPSAPFAFSREA